MTQNNFHHNGLKRTTALILIGALICVSLSGCYLFPEEEEKLYAPTLTVADVTYTTIPAAKGSIERWDTNLASFGTVASESYSFGSPGTLKKIYVKPGDKVKPGDLLAEYDTRIIDSKIEYQDYKTSRAYLVYQVAVAEHGAGSAQANLAQLDYSYEKKLLDALEAQKGESALYSSIDGSVMYTASLLGAGAEVEAGKVLVTIADTTQMVIMYEAENLEEIHAGMEVKCSIKNKNIAFTGIVIQTPNDVPADAGTNDKNFVYISFDEMEETPIIGSSIYCEILLEKKEDIIVLPARYLNTTGTRYYVRVLVDGLPEERDVTIGMTDGSNYEITSGLEVGDLIVT